MLISLVGLVNAMTMGIMERTREIGVLRCVGARGRHVRRIFRAEGVTVAILGWLIGIPLGWAMAHGFISATSSIVKTDLSFVFPPANVVITLVGTNRAGAPRPHCATAPGGAPQARAGATTYVMAERRRARCPGTELRSGRRPGRR